MGTDGNTDRQTSRQVDNWIAGQITDRQTVSWRVKCMDEKTTDGKYRQTDKYREQMDNWTGNRWERQTYRHKDRRRDKCMDGQTTLGGQTDRQMDRCTDQ